MKLFSSAGSCLLVAIALTGCAPNLTVSNSGEGGSAGGSGMAGSGGSTSSSSGSTSSSSGMMGGPCNECLPAPPTDWTYVHIRQTDFGQSTDPCFDGSQPLRYYADPSSAECKSCSCSAPGSCSSTITCYTNLGCAGMTGVSEYATTTGCVPFLIGITPVSCKLTSPGTIPAGATCTVSGGELSNPNPFGSETHVCPATANGSGCDSSTCIAAPPQEYQNQVCVIHTGNKSCPAGFSNKRTVHGNYSDTRSCTPCSCDANAIACSGSPSISLWGDTNCTMNPQTIPTDGTCTNFAAMPSHVTAGNLPKRIVPPGACNGGDSTGNVNTTDDLTICCQTF